jgi:endonuclease/exonuclease/phosphatase family metal-dependent hydrolase
MSNVRIILLMGPDNEGKAQWESIFTQGAHDIGWKSTADAGFTQDARWKWLPGDTWRREMITVLNNGYNVVVAGNLCSFTERLELYGEIERFNFNNLESQRRVDTYQDIIALVCHPSVANGNKKWNEIMQQSKSEELTSSVSKLDYLHLPIGEMARIYRILDMDNGKTVRWNKAALEAASCHNWVKLDNLAESITYAPLWRVIVQNPRNRKETIKETLSILSYNILWQPKNRCTWSTRLPTLIASISSRNPDIICLQEVSTDMYNDLRMNLASYGSSFGICKKSSFGCATFFKTAILDLDTDYKPLELVEKNEEYNTKRVIAHLTTLKHTTLSQVVVCNTHLMYGFNEPMEKKRKESIQLIRKLLNRNFLKRIPKIICGDFNSKAQSDPLLAVTSGREFQDVYHTVLSTDPEMTVEVYQHGDPIAVDYVFASKHFTPYSVLQMPTIRSMRRKQLPIPGFEGSDHLYHFTILAYKSIV